ncbi:MAG: type II toxin-antitoxin system VapC family toxin [Desulfurococcales archaeon]|nr:type II toxin-antitoxin system VapC family toxin [Desulfurococcales archaeon]
MRIFVDASLVIYLNVPLPEDEAKVIEGFWLELVDGHSLYTDVLVLDEVVYVSRRKYRVPVNETLEFIDRIVLQYVDVLPLRLDEYLEARDILRRHSVNPSDALHAAVVRLNRLDAVASEDKDFDKLGIRRLWPSRPV